MGAGALYIRVHKFSKPIVNVYVNLTEVKRTKDIRERSIIVLEQLVAEDRSLLQVSVTLSCRYGTST